jgi:WD40 repeat protein
MKSLFSSLWGNLGTVLTGLAILMLVPSVRGQQFGPWSVPVNLGATVNSSCSDQHPALSKDGLTLVFASDRIVDDTGHTIGCLGNPFNLHLWFSARDCLDTNDPTCAWQMPQPLATLNSSFQDNAPNLTTDGHWVFFHSERPFDPTDPAQQSCNLDPPGGGHRYFELWAAHRQNRRDDSGWEAPINLGCTLNTLGASEAGPTFWEDDSTGTLYLYFNSDPLPPDSDPLGNATDIYVSTCTADLDTCNRQQLWISATLVPELSSPVRDTRTAIRRRDGLEMFISSNRSGGVGGLDLWVSTRASALDPWSIPINLNQDNLNKGGDALVNTSANEGAPALSWDGQTLIFYSNRAGGFGGNDLYMTTRTKLGD